MSIIRTKQIEGYNENLLEQSKEFKRIKRQMKLYELSLSAVEKENQELKKELAEIKNLLLNK